MNIPLIFNDYIMQYDASSLLKLETSNQLYKINDTLSKKYAHLINIGDKCWVLIQYDSNVLGDIRQI